MCAGNLHSPLSRGGKILAKNFNILSRIFRKTYRDSFDVNQTERRSTMLMETTHTNTRNAAYKSRVLYFQSCVSESGIRGICVRIFHSTISVCALLSCVFINYASRHFRRGLARVVRSRLQCGRGFEASPPTAHVNRIRKRIT